MTTIIIIVIPCTSEDARAFMPWNSDYVNGQLHELADSPGSSVFSVSTPEHTVSNLINAPLK